VAPTSPPWFHSSKLNRVGEVAPTSAPPTAIYVLDHGAIIEHGTHPQLIQQDGRYAELFQLQARAYRDNDSGLEPARAPGAEGEAGQDLPREAPDGEGFSQAEPGRNVS
jgi:hypothetical protein